MLLVFFSILATGDSFHLTIGGEVNLRATLRGGPACCWRLYSTSLAPSADCERSVLTPGAQRRAEIDRLGCQLTGYTQWLAVPACEPREGEHVLLLPVVVLVLRGNRNKQARMMNFRSAACLCMCVRVASLRPILTRLLVRWQFTVMIIIKMVVSASIVGVF